MAKDTTTTIVTPKTTTPDTTSWNTAGRNVKFQALDGFLFIAVPISADAIAAAPTSKSGKSKSIGSTEGNVAIPGMNTKFGVNVYQPV